MAVVAVAHFRPQPHPLGLLPFRLHRAHIHRRAFHAGGARSDLVRALASLRVRRVDRARPARARCSMRRRLWQFSACARRGAGDRCRHLRRRGDACPRTLSLGQSRVCPGLRHAASASRSQCRRRRLVRDHRASGSPARNARGIPPRADAGGRAGHFLTQPSRLQRSGAGRESLSRQRARSRRTEGAARSRVSAAGLACTARGRPVRALGRGGRRQRNALYGARIGRSP